MRKKDQIIKKYKTVAGLKRALKRRYNQGTVFYSDNEKIQQFLEEMGIVAICGTTGAAVGFYFGGPVGALVGGSIGIFAGLVIIEKIKIKCIRKDPFGGYEVIFA